MSTNGNGNGDTPFANCDTQTDSVARNVIATFCGTTLGIVRSVNAVDAVELVDITSITNTKRNFAEAFKNPTATVEIGAMPDMAVPASGLRGELVISGAAVAYEEYLIIESVSTAIQVGEAITYTVEFKSAIDMSDSSGEET